MNQMSRGWVSLPVLLIVGVVAWQLFERSSELNNENMWSVQRYVSGTVPRWRTVFQALEERRSMQKPISSECVDFCALEDSPWNTFELDDGFNVSYQLHKISGLDVERWCAALDSQNAMCWWLVSGTARSSVIVSL